MNSLNAFREGELVEEVSKINYNLERDFRKINNRPEYRVVWSDDQLEKRIVNTTDEGFELINPEVREVRKYQHIAHRYVLERLTEIKGETDLVSDTNLILSYEPIWTFEDRFGNYLPPRLDACKIIIDQIETSLNHKMKPIVKEDLSEEAKTAEINRIEQILFGNETPVTDALHYGTGVTDFNPKVH